MGCKNWNRPPATAEGSGAGDRTAARRPPGLSFPSFGPKKTGTCRWQRPKAPLPDGGNGQITTMPGERSCLGRGPSCAEGRGKVWSLGFAATSLFLNPVWRAAVRPTPLRDPVPPHPPPTTTDLPARRRRAAARGAAARLEAHWRHERPARGGAATARPLGGAGAPRGAGGLDAAGPCLCVGPHGASRRQRQSGPAAGGVSQMSRARQLRRRGPLARAARRRAAAVRDRTHSDPARID